MNNRCKVIDHVADCNCKCHRFESTAQSGHKWGHRMMSGKG